MTIAPKIDVWYHGSREKFTGPIRPLYLTPHKALASIHGNLYAFRINPEAEWLDLSEYEGGFVPSIDSLGYHSSAPEKLRNKGFDIAWEREDFRRGHTQIYVLNPNVLQSVSLDEQMLCELIENILSEFWNHVC